MAHIHDLIDYTVEVYIIYNKKLLLRLHDKYNVWLSVGGHIELNEDPNQAATREVKEEVGLDIVLATDLLPKTRTNAQYKELIPPKFLNIHSINPNHRHVSMVYFAKSLTAEIKPGNKEVITKYRWLTREELQQDDEIYPEVKIYGLKALEELS